MYRDNDNEDSDNKESEFAQFTLYSFVWKGFNNLSHGICLLGGTTTQALKTGVKFLLFWLRTKDCQIYFA